MMENSSNSNYTLVNVADYQGAQALATKAQEILNNELRPLANRNATNSIAKLEDGLIQISNLIENKIITYGTGDGRAYTSSSRFTSSV
jgi:hypothetical protein